MSEQIREYNESLDSALLAYVEGNEEPFASHCSRFGVTLPSHPHQRPIGSLIRLTPPRKY